MMPNKTLLTGLMVALLGSSLQSLNAKPKKISPQYHNATHSDRRLISSANYDFNNRNELQKVNTNYVDSLHILAIRVAFQQDTDLETTGDGTFDFSTDSKIIIDTPPHNKTYFQNQLVALSNYFQSVSRGKLILQADVMPAGEDAAYNLPEAMSYYNPNTTDEELDVRLAELFRDAWQSADQQDNIDFSAYDVFIVFHAGVGSEYTLDLDSTPKDIPSVFLNSQDLDNSLGQKYIEVSGGHIPDGIILPETESQMGYDIGLLGTMTLMFGHQLGLPNLYDTETGHPGIGVFGMMDQGSANFSGVMPAQPCAWSKVFLGWETPIEVTNGTALEIAASLDDNPNKIYKIPINSQEYYLLENRQRHVLRDANTTIGYDHDGLKLQFTDDGDITTPNENDKIGVITSIEEYDFGLPGSGILIWHIDEQVIFNNYMANQVNVDMDHRGIDLVEADGAQDIGHFYNFFGITGYEAGTEWDMWWNDNEAFAYANDSAAVALTPETTPNSSAHSGARSNISITNFSESKAVMTFDVSLSSYKQGFPQPFSFEARPAAISIADIDGQAGAEIVLPLSNGQILAWKDDGTKVIANTDSLRRTDLKNNIIGYPLPIFADLGASITSAVAIFDMDNDGVRDVLINDNNIYAFSRQDADADGRADKLFAIELNSTVSTPPLVLPAQKLQLVGTIAGTIHAIDFNGSQLWQANVGNSPIAGMARFSHSGTDSIVAVNQSGNVFLINTQGNVEWTSHFETVSEMNPPVVGDLNADGKLEIVVSDTEGQVSILSVSGNSEAAYQLLFIQDNEISNPVLGDLDGNGTLEIVFNGQGNIWALNYQARPVANFPIEYQRNAGDIPVVDPLLVDLDGDDDLEIIIAADNYVCGYHHNGDVVESFPLSMGGMANASPAIADINGNGRIDIAVTADDGYLYVWELPFNFSEEHVVWGQYRGDALNSAMIAASSGGMTPEQASDLMPEKTVYNWPNPNEDNHTFIHYWLNEQADVSIRIYDMVGELVQEFSGTSFAQADNSVPVDLTDIQSGVYIVRVEASNSSVSSTAFFKMAVVK